LKGNPTSIEIKSQNVIEAKRGEWRMNE